MPQPNQPVSLPRRPSGTEHSFANGPSWDYWPRNRAADDCREPDSELHRDADAVVLQLLPILDAARPIAGEILTGGACGDASAAPTPTPAPTPAATPAPTPFRPAAPAGSCAGGAADCLAAKKIGCGPTAAGVAAGTNDAAAGLPASTKLFNCEGDGRVTAPVAALAAPVPGLGRATLAVAGRLPPAMGELIAGDFAAPAAGRAAGVGAGRARGRVARSAPEGRAAPPPPAWSTAATAARPASRKLDRNDEQQRSDDDQYHVQTFHGSPAFKFMCGF